CARRDYDYGWYFDVW
nr:immunoglobulin heavy chain junction region [Mus musculus]